jgi:ABC-type dipeptide/oligopeptide/nickel transport system permease component
VLVSRSRTRDRWLRGIVTLDFGNSFIDHRLVTERIARRG